MRICAKSGALQKGYPRPVNLRVPLRSEASKDKFLLFFFQLTQIPIEAQREIRRLTLTMDPDWLRL